jgi:hypothetical protein
MNMNFRKLLFLVLFATSFLSSTYFDDAMAEQSTTKSDESNLRQLMDKAFIEPSDDQPPDWSYDECISIKSFTRVLRAVCGTPATKISDKDIEHLISFIKIKPDKDGLEKLISLRTLFAAQVLAYLGPRAKRAIPLLEDVIRKEQTYRNSLGGSSGVWYSDSLVEMTKTIKGEKAPRDCRLMTDIKFVVQQIKSQSQEEAESQGQNMLIGVLYASYADDISDSDVNAIISLLADSDSRKAMAGVAGLHYIGPKASRAVPTLEDFQKKLDKPGAALIGRDYTTENAKKTIEATLESLKGKRLPAGICQTSSSVH